LFQFGDGQNWFMLTKIGAKLNITNEYRDQIEYKTLTLTHGTLLSWHMGI